MDYRGAKTILRDALTPPANVPDFTSRLVASPGRMSAIDASTAGNLPEGDTYGDRILQSLLVVWRYVVGQTMVERELAGILIQLAAPIRVLAADSGYSDTRIPQILLILDAISLSCMAQPEGGANGKQPSSPETNRPLGAAASRRSP